MIVSSSESEAVDDPGKKETTNQVYTKDDVEDVVDEVNAKGKGDDQQYHGQNEQVTHRRLGLVEITDGKFCFLQNC